MVLLWDKLLSALGEKKENSRKMSTFCPLRSHLNVGNRMDPFRSSLQCTLLEFFPSTHSHTHTRTHILPPPLSLTTASISPCSSGSRVVAHSVDSHTSEKEILHSDVWGVGVGRGVTLLQGVIQLPG